jgi:hypothetical protein
LRGPCMLTAMSCKDVNEVPDTDATHVNHT